MSKEEPEFAAGSIVITSDTLEIDNQRSLVIFTDNVNAQKDDVNIKCQQMLVYYKNQAAEGKKEDMKVSIDRIVVSGNVRITSDNGIQANAEKAVYYHDQEKVILSGNPIVKQGNDFVEGSEITLFLKEKRSTVLGSEDNRVRAVIFPRKEKR
ncbi:lipopolysaccharide transport periplasmic protein LptA [Thermodesulfobacteriota bacterium]